MLVQDTSVAACHAERTTTDAGLQAAYMALKPVFELQEKQKNDRLALANVLDVVNGSSVVSGKLRNEDVLASLPRFFDDDDVCPDCLSKGLVVDDDDGEFAVCGCMSFDPWASTWIEDVLNRLVVQAQRVA